MNKTDKIRQLNDILRTTFTGGQVVLSIGIRMKTEKEVADILERVRTFNDFTPANNPYKENDCASFDYNGERIIWKIDYYDKNYRYHSDDPSNPDITNRVMTIMTSEEY